MLYTRFLVIGLSGLLSTATGLSLDAKCKHHVPPPNLHEVPLLVDLIRDFHLYPFCAEYIHKPEFPHTTTKIIGTATKTITTHVQVTDTVTHTSASGTVDVTDTTTLTVIVTYTAATATVPDTTTVSSTTTVTITPNTITSLAFPTPTGFEAKRDVRPGLDEHGRDPVPAPLHGAPDNLLSEACLSALATRTFTIYTRSTTVSTQTVTKTATAVDTAFTPATTATDIVTDATTESVPVTETITSTTTITATPTVTSTATATVSVCPDQQSVDGGGVQASGQLMDSTSPDALQCCTACFETEGCGLWFFFPPSLCFNAVDVSGPNPDAQCPTGFGPYVIFPGSPDDGNVGGPGPCAGSFVDD
ncbi:hypothetical protein N7510_004820 [Penicillium lagena]|uniref:uncharacterized protein n=1 Tax=Penicillium lagena TaxID=94218 RepID=UPI0025423022|nr:uncharacterized protein N7510_004820 [Penicillium lagena]KAJ5620836.1 hypothetical protein N7510_004820 [Penicillium lagena]